MEPTSSQEASSPGSWHTFATS